MNVQETIIGKIAQARAIKQSISFSMPSEVFKVMNGHWNKLLDEAEELNETRASNKNFYKNLEEINEVADIKIIEKY